MKFDVHVFRKFCTFVLFCPISREAKLIGCGIGGLTDVSYISCTVF